MFVSKFKHNNNNFKWINPKHFKILNISTFLLLLPFSFSYWYFWILKHIMQNSYTSWTKGPFRLLLSLQQKSIEALQRHIDNVLGCLHNLQGLPGPMWYLYSVSPSRLFFHDFAQPLLGTCALLPDSYIWNLHPLSFKTSKKMCTTLIFTNTK